MALALAIVVAIYSSDRPVTSDPLSYKYVNHSRSLWQSVRADAATMLSTQGTSTSLYSTRPRAESLGGVDKV